VAVTVFQRKDGRWQATLCLGGRRKAFYGRTRQQVQARAEEYLRTLGLRPLPEPGKARVTFGDLLDQVLSDPTLRPRTAEDYRRTARHLEGLRPVRLDRITPYALAAVLHPLRSRPRRALKVYQLLSRVLRQAVRLGLVGSNPLEGVEPPRYRPERPRPWAPEQVAAFLQAARGHPMEGLFWVLSTGGLRVSEATALRWCDFDFQAGTLRVERAVHRVGGSWVFCPPKTRAGHRVVHLPAQALEVLKRARVLAIQQALASGRPWSEEDLAFQATGGGPLHRRAVQRAMQALARKAGLPAEGARPHALRHAHASALLTGGLGLAEVSRRLGHSSPTITASVYSHALSKDREAAELVERLLAQARR
jgi:integrase